MSKMKTYLSLLSFIVCCSFGYCVQPYFPDQIVFRVDTENATYAIDKINQKAFVSRSNDQSPTVNAFVMAQIPHATPDSPQAKYTTELTGNGEDFDSCNYASYWAYGGKQNSEFPDHWHHGTTFSVGNYLKFIYNLVHWTNSSVDYWRSIETCLVPSLRRIHCEEMFFEKDTDIPIQYNYIHIDGQHIYPQTIRFTDVTVGKSVNNYFKTIPKDWTTKCTDLNLALLVSDTTVLVNVNESAGVSLWLSTPPHLINGNNDTVIITWTISSECADCFTSTPKRFVFNSRNFMEKQTLTITRVKTEAGSYGVLTSVIHGGGLDDSSKYQKNIYVV